MNRPLVSVVIPVYNGESFVAEAISSALSQTYRPLEVIVVDDASTDGTEEVITGRFAGEIVEGTVRYLRNDVNRERSFSRNRGVDAARGEFICFLDHDDLWDARYVAAVAGTFADNESDIVYVFPRTFVDEHGSVLRHSNKQIPVDSGELIFSSQVGYPSATSFRRTSFPGYIDSCILREDWEIFLRAYLDGRQVHVLDGDLVRMRAHGGRTSRSVKFMASTLAVYRRYRDRVPPAYRGPFLYHVADICLRYGDLPRGWQVAAMAMAAGYLPGLRMIHRLVTRGIRIDRYLTLAADRKKFMQGDALR